MNWYKQADRLHIQTFEDRNVVTAKIAYLESLVPRLRRLAKIVFQDAKTAKAENYSYLNDVKLSTYSSVRDLMSEADRVALDSPWKFSELCTAVADELNVHILNLKSDLDEFARKTAPARMKGWVERHAR